MLKTTLQIGNKTGKSYHRNYTDSFLNISEDVYTTEYTLGMILIFLMLTECVRM